MRRALFTATALLAVAAPASHATTLKVTTTADTLAAGSGCSLRAAVIAANTDTATGGCKAGSGADVIRLATGATYTFSIAGSGQDASATGDLDVTGALSIKGSGATIDAAGLDRVITVLAGGTLKLSDATLTGGAPVPAGSPTAGGGALLNRGTTTLSHVTMEHNSVGGKDADDAAVAANFGSLTMTDSTIAENDQAPGSQGFIDGVSNAGTLALRRTVLRDGVAGLRNLRGGVATVVDGRISGNAGIAVTNDGSMKLTRTTVSGNETGSEAPGLFASGIFNQQGELSVTDSTVRDNSVDSMVDRFGQYTGPQGAGITNWGTLHLSGSTVSGNTIVQHCLTNSVTTCSQSIGAGIANNGRLDITNATVSGNTIDFSCTVAIPAEDPPCPTDAGAGIANYGTGSTTAVALTLADNHGGGLGGGIAVLGGSVSLTDAIVAANTVSAGGTGPDCSGTVAVFAYSLLGNAAGCTITTSTSSLSGLDPLLGPLADNGGPTFTMALDPPSPAVDAGPAKKRLGCPKADQRDTKRPQGAGCDIGAYELTEGLTP